MTSLTRQRDAAVDAAHAAARVIRRYAGAIADSSVREKATHDLVTEVDELAQETIISHLQRAFPEYAVLAEEGAVDQPALEADGFRWIIDPIDGTTNYLHGIPPYAVSIALQHDAELLAGVVYDVAHDELFTAIRGEGAYANGRRMQVSSTASLGRSLITTGFPYRSFDDVDAYLAAMRSLMLNTRGLRRPGSASVDLAWVAAGRFDAFFETDLGPWDVAAGIVLVEEAGGRAGDFDGGPVPLSGREILASNGHIHGMMLEQLEPLRGAR